jgi:photosystem II stability/assembly factor-like uncharacterized protein
MKRLLPLILLIIFSIPLFLTGQVKDKNESTLGMPKLSDSTYNSMRWRMIGPFRGGRTLAASGIPGNPNTFYFGAVDGGVWRTTNAGVTWVPLTDGQTNPSIGALAIAPSNEKIIYIGTGEADMRSDITYGTGVYKSTDGGEHWTHLGLEDTRHIGKILIDPNNPDIVFIAALGHAYGSSNERGVFKTTDGGKTWKKVLYKNDETGAVDLSWDTENTNVIYASMWQAQRTPWSQYPPNEGPGSGLYKSTDIGNTWNEIKGNGFPEDTLGRIGVAVVNGSNGNKLFALVESQGKNSGLYYSNDGGKTWELRSTNEQIITRMWYFGRVFVDPTNPEIVYIPNRSVFRSEDGGKTFTAIKGSPGGDDYHYVWIDPINNNRLIEAADQGAAVSLDYGKTWSSWYNQPTAQFYHISVDNQFPYRVYGAQQDCGTVSITSRSDYGQISYRDWYPIGAGEAGYIAPDPNNPNIVYGGNTYGGLYRYDNVTGQSQVVEPWLLASFSTPMQKRKYRFTWTSPIGFDPHNSNALYFGSQYLLRTTDGGLIWKEVSPDLSGADKNVKDETSPLSVSNASKRGMGVIYSFSFSPVKSGIIWVGTDDGKIQLTEDNGSHWKDVTPKKLQPWSKIGIIDASPFDTKTAYVTVDRHRLDDFTPYIYKTTDSGKSWVLINKGIPDLSFVRAVRSDTKKKGLLYAGTETGVYISFNDGENWQPLQLNLPTVAVRDLAVHDNDLIAATHGRAFWILDDLSPFRQLNANVIKNDVTLFEPEIATRIRRSENGDTPLPPETPLGQNPPAGAIINYYLGQNVSGEITLSVFDKAGTLIRHYSSNDKEVPPSSQPYFMPEWLPVFKPLTTHAGINRFVWDLHYPPMPTKNTYYSMEAIVGDGTRKEPAGPMALPGEYKIVLTVNGKAHSQNLRVKMDPRVKVSEKALKDQLNLGLEIWNTSSDHHNLSLSVNSVVEQLPKLDSKADNNLTAKIKIANTKIDEIKKLLSGSNPANLETAVFSADREPTEQMRTGFNELNGKIKAASKKWNSLKNMEINEINAILQRSGSQTLRIPDISPEQYNLSK